LELIVVLVLLIVVVVVAFPFRCTNMSKARAAQDANNLRQLGIGINQYANDHDDVMFSMDAKETWANVLHEKYIVDWRCYQSPFDHRTAPANPPMPLSYALNAVVMSPREAKSVRAEKDAVYEGKLAQWADPSRLIVMAPNPPKESVTFTGTTAMNLTMTPPPVTPKAGTFGNRNSIIVLFGDFHVSAMLWKDFSDSTSMPDGVSRWKPMGNSTAKP